MGAHVKPGEELPVRTPEHILGRLIRKERMYREWTQAQLATRSNEFNLCRLSQRKISDIETGRGVWAHELMAIARAFGLNAEYFDLTPERMNSDPE